MGFIDFGAEIREIKNHTGAIFNAFNNLRKEDDNRFEIHQDKLRDMLADKKILTDKVDNLENKINDLKNQNAKIIEQNADLKSLFKSFETLLIGKFYPRSESVETQTETKTIVDKEVNTISKENKNEHTQTVKSTTDKVTNTKTIKQKNCVTNTEKIITKDFESNTDALFSIDEKTKKEDKEFQTDWSLITTLEEADTIAEVLDEEHFDEPQASKVKTSLEVDKKEKNNNRFKEIERRRKSLDAVTSVNTSKRKRIASNDAGPEHVPKIKVAGPWDDYDRRTQDQSGSFLTGENNSYRESTPFIQPFIKKLFGLASNPNKCNNALQFTDRESLRGGRIFNLTQVLVNETAWTGLFLDEFLDAKFKEDRRKQLIALLEKHRFKIFYPKGQHVLYSESFTASNFKFDRSAKDLHVIRPNGTVKWPNSNAL